ncbi:MAG: EmrB/QacA subfamily drug resistance transporter [Desulforhopalus sp.]|jgi:EmrB/QacA subfamily drug resistance transporter
MTLLSADEKRRNWIIWSTLLALFLGALDALVMTAAMPTIIAELGGLEFYAWTYTAYFMARAVSLPIFGKLSDMYPSRVLFLFSIGLFLVASIAAGCSQSMAFLVVTRVFQGIGCGGIFALVYVVLSDVSAPEQRAKTISFASVVWGIASLVGPTLGGFIVTWFSWRWIFFINIPLGIFSLVGIALYFKEYRVKPVDKDLDILGATLLSGFILGLLTLIITGGRELPVSSVPYILIVITTVISGIWFYKVEVKAANPVLNFSFFKSPSYTLGNVLVFFASFAIFSLFAYAPIFLQGALSQSPIEVGYAMVSLSIGWSVGSLLAGRNMNSIGQWKMTVIGAVLVVVGTGMTLTFSLTTGMMECFVAFLIVGLGMGFVSLTTLLVVQNSVEFTDLGTATSFHQFSRTMGGTIGVGLCGGIVTDRLVSELTAAGQNLPGALIEMLKESTANLFQAEFQAMVPKGMELALQDAVLSSVYLAFIIVFIVSVINLGLSLLLPKK